MPDEQEISREYEKDVSQYYGDEKVTAIITLKVDTKEVDTVARTVCENPGVKDVFLVTGDTDLVIKATFDSYKAFKQFVVGDVGNIKGVIDTSTGMVVTKYKENRKLIMY